MKEEIIRSDMEAGTTRRKISRLERKMWNKLFSEEPLRLSSMGMTIGKGLRTQLKDKYYEQRYTWPSWDPVQYKVSRRMGTDNAGESSIFGDAERISFRHIQGEERTF